jgi:hypothetical protein
VLVVDGDGEPITGLTNVKVRVRRLSDNWHFDWSDQSFKANPTTLLHQLVEINSLNSPGEYHLDTAPHSKGFNTSAITNKVANDTYVATVVQDGGTEDADNLPAIGEIKEGQFADFIDQAISDNASPAEVLQALRDFGLDHLVAVNPGVVPPAAGTYIRQILDKLNGMATHMLEMSFSYDPDGDTFTGNVWLESGNLVVVNSGSIQVDVYDQDRSLQFSMTAASPDAGGVFKVTRTPTGLVKNRSYYAEAEVTLPAGGGTVKGIKGMFTVG